MQCERLDFSENYSAIRTNLKAKFCRRKAVCIFVLGTRHRVSVGCCLLLAVVGGDDLHNTPRTEHNTMLESKYSGE